MKIDTNHKKIIKPQFSNLETTFINDRDEINKIQKNCPLCNSDNVNIQYVLNSETVTQRLLDRSLDEKKFIQVQTKIEKIWGSNKCVFLRCNECSFGFGYPFISADTDLYSLLYDNQEAYSKWKWEYQITYELLKKKVEYGNLMNAKLIEIGAGTGAFIKKISPNLIRKDNIICTEYSIAGLLELENFGIKCFSRDIREAFFLEYLGYFDIVCIFQVLEHLDNLDDFFTRIELITKKHADIFIAVPNGKMRKFYDTLSCYLDVPPIHLSRWNKECFNYIIKRFNWVIKDYRLEPQSFLSKIIVFLRILYSKTRICTWIKSIRISFLRKTGHIIAALIFALFYLPEIYTLKSKKLGESQWIHIQKEAIY